MLEVRYECLKGICGVLNGTRKVENSRIRSFEVDLCVETFVMLSWQDRSFKS